jgi:hypothetical protein
MDERMLPTKPVVFPRPISRERAQRPEHAETVEQRSIREVIVVCRLVAVVLRELGVKIEPRRARRVGAKAAFTEVKLAYVASVNLESFVSSSRTSVAAASQFDGGSFGVLLRINSAGRSPRA